MAYRAIVAQATGLTALVLGGIGSHLTDNTYLDLGSQLIAYSGVYLASRSHSYFSYIKRYQDSIERYSVTNAQEKRLKKF